MRLTLEPLVPEPVLDRLHAWITHPRAVFWGMQDATRADVLAEYARLCADPHHEVLLGRADGVPQFLVERYDPAYHPGLRLLPELEPGDLGMHLLVAPTDRPVPGFTSAVMRAVVASCLEVAPRVVVEPDVRNDRIARLNAAAGFRVLREVPLHDKTAALSVCTRADFAASDLGRGAA